MKELLLKIYGDIGWLKMEIKQIIMMIMTLLMCSGMAYLVGDFHGYIRGMDKAQEILDDK